MRVVVFVALSLTLLGASRAARETCVSELESRDYTGDGLRADLVDDSFNLLGTVVVSLVPRKDGQCFRVEFASQREGASFLKLRAGMFTQGENLPTGKERFTRRKQVAELISDRVVNASMDICPDRIQVLGSPCCGLLSFFAFAVMRVRVGNGTDAAVRAFLVPSAETIQHCSVPDTNKPFRYVCTLENSCE